MHTRSIGNIGENIACEFLRRRGFDIVARNYRKKWGEIDIIAHPCAPRGREMGIVARETIHFFEVKSTTFAGRNPEENVHASKTRHIKRMIETYMTEFGWRPFQFHVLCVYMNNKTCRARVKWLKDIVL